MAILRPNAPKPSIVAGEYVTSQYSAVIGVAVEQDGDPVLTIDEQFFGKRDLIELRDLLNEFIEAGQ